MTEIASYVPSEVRFAHVSSHPSVELGRIHGVISSEKDLLHPPLEAISDSYRRGQAIAMLNGRENEAVGFTRFTPLLDSDLKRKLGLQGMPDIVELGTAVVDPEHRGRGHFGPLSNALLETVQEDVANKNVLIIGTTKTIPYLRSLEKARTLGIHFEAGSHDEFPMIEPLTCVCTGCMGQGMQLTPDCPQRIQPQQIIRLHDVAAESPTGIEIPCVMFVSDKGLAQEIDGKIAERFTYGGSTPQQNLTRALIGARYYD